jgi:hypothetical protein
MNSMRSDSLKGDYDSIVNFLDRFSADSAGHASVDGVNQNANVFKLPQLPLDINREIAPCLYTHQNHFFDPHPHGKYFKALGCTAKLYLALMEEAKEKWNKEHINLKTQIHDQYGYMGLLLSGGWMPPLQFIRGKINNNGHEFIGFICRKNHSVADLAAFGDNITNEILEKLFKTCPTIDHLIVSSKNVNALPPACTRLQTLICNDCGLKTIREGMSLLTMLDCKDSPLLTTLPDDMHLLKKIFFSRSPLTTLPPSLAANLVSISCVDCPTFTMLPVGMAAMEELYCTGSGLTALPSDFPPNCKVIKVDEPMLG